MKRFHPELWVSPRPNGIGLQKPNHFGDMARIAWTNKKNASYAWKILTKGVCDGCALGVAGLHDWTIDGVHLCLTRLRLLEVNCADALDHSVLADVDALKVKTGAELRDLGRLAYPMRRRRGDAGFRQITWDEAMDAMADSIRATDPERVAMFVTSRGITNETYYVAGKSARAMGIANVDSAARICHAPSTTALKSTVGIAATTCSLSDVIESDLIVIWGANPANNQPVFMKYLYEARCRGARVVVINPYLEPGLERYWVPSSAESAMFGTKMCDLHVPVRPGGDVAFADAALKRLIERGAVDQEFIDAHTENWDQLVAHLESLPMADLLADAGLTEQQLDAFVDEYERADATILLWSMGITQHRHAGEGVRGIVNLALAKGNVGRNGAGLMPLRGHSGVQGGAEMGAYASALPGGLEPNEANAALLAERWGFDVPAHSGLTAAEVPEAAERGELDVLWMSGGNFLDVLPDPVRVEAAMERIPLRVHQDIVVSSQMLVPGDDVILLPVHTRYEQEGGGTETTTERRIVFSPEIPRQLGEARSEWRVFADVASRVRTDLADKFEWTDNRSLRQEIARVVPLYAGIETLADTGDQVQWGGRHLCVDGAFPTASGRGSFSVNERPSLELAEGEFTVATRRGKQFNSMILGEVDPMTGAVRDSIYIDAADAATGGFLEGDRVTLHSEIGSYTGHLKFARLPSRSLQVHWPEGNVLIPAGPSHREGPSRVPDYNAVVTIAPAIAD
jgi:molybdopterin-dependent oxidoreductase alpha subunit